MLICDNAVCYVFLISRLVLKVFFLLVLCFVCTVASCTVFQVNMIKEDGQVIHFNNPKAQASLAANTFSITGHAETKRRLNLFSYLEPVLYSL